MHSFVQGQLKQWSTYAIIASSGLLFYIFTSLTIVWPRLKDLAGADILSHWQITFVGITSIFATETIYTKTTATITLLNALLFGIVILLFARMRTVNQTHTAKSVAKTSIATMLAAIGAGCAACGTLLLGPLLATLGATGLLALLPGHGIEFSLLGTLLLLYSVYTMAKKVSRPQVCAV